jgi:asparagine synthase (glutamine-hydrolysing)
MADSPLHSLPKEILQRPKTGFGVPVREWLMHGNITTKGPTMERGLRGWSKLILEHFLTTEQIPQPCPTPFADASAVL